MDMQYGRQNETIDIHYLNSGGTNFSFVTRLSMPAGRRSKESPETAFSADGSKFALAMDGRGVSVWDVRSKVPLQTFMETPWPKELDQPQRFLQFISGNSGQEILVFVEVCLMFIF